MIYRTRRLAYPSFIPRKLVVSGIKNQINLRKQRNPLSHNTCLITTLKNSVSFLKMVKYIVYFTKSFNSIILYFIKISYGDFDFCDWGPFVKFFRSWTMHCFNTFNKKIHALSCFCLCISYVRFKMMVFIYKKVTYLNKFKCVKCSKAYKTKGVKSWFKLSKSIC